ncbi:MAG TPA: Holliday junction resolvase RuvX [Egibacteraceae bacterium]|nr:Holliday junction resolvase RuvX [Egibacteraceae bacterium]
MGRVLGVDVGTVRVGLAVSDPGEVVATPVGAIPAAEEPAALAAAVAAAAAEHGCRRVVVGLPRGMSGRDTASTARARAVARALGDEGLQVSLWDERLSSAEAERVLLAAGRRRGQRRTERDQVAAAIVLQGWLDAQRRPRE